MSDYYKAIQSHDRQPDLDRIVSAAYEEANLSNITHKDTAGLEDIRHIEVISKGVGDRLHLGVDVNQGWLVSIVDRVPAWDLNRAV